jgi:hypothetical protein
MEEDYGQSGKEVILWDTTSNYARVRELRLQGKTVPQIAAELNLKPSTVKQSLTNHLKAEAARLDEVEIGSIIQLEMDRLDHLIQAHWFAAQTGDIDSGRMLISVSKERREWLKWAKPENTGEVGITNNILVVGGSESEFIASLDAAKARLESEQAKKYGTLEVEDGSGSSDQ